MDRDEFMEIVYETFADEPDNVLANGIIEAADAYVEHEKAQLSQEGTTKDATSDLIEEIRCAMCRNQMKTDRGCDGNCRVDENLYKAIIQILEKHLPSAQPEQHYDEWCTGCKEYDQKRHNCPRWNKVIRQTLKDIEPKEGHWIPHETPDGGEQYECSRCGVLWEFNDGTPEDNEAYFCPKCGAKMKGVKHETD